MSRASRLIRKLDKLLGRRESFGDAPEASVDGLVEELEEQLQAIKAKEKPEHWAEIYVERDRALIKQQVLNRVMDLGSK